MACSSGRLARNDHTFARRLDLPILGGKSLQSKHVALVPREIEAPPLFLIAPTEHLGAFGRAGVRAERSQALAPSCAAATTGNMPRVQRIAPGAAPARGPSAGRAAARVVSAECGEPAAPRPTLALWLRESATTRATQNARSSGFNRGRFCPRAWVASCCRRARFSSAREPRDLTTARRNQAGRQSRRP